MFFSSALLSTKFQLLLFIIIGFISVVDASSSSSYLTNSQLIATKTAYETARNLFRYFLKEKYDIANASCFGPLKDDEFVVKFEDEIIRSTTGIGERDLQEDILHSNGDYNNNNNRDYWDGGKKTQNNNEAATTMHPDSCKVRQFSLLLRHGSRYPSSGDIKRISKLLKKWATLNIHSKYAATKQWQNDFTTRNEKKLSPSGWKELFAIAQRVSYSLQDLFKQAFLENTFELMASDTQRTIASAEGFVNGLAQTFELDSQQIMNRLEKRNDLIRFFDRCNVYKYKVDDSDETLLEFKKFLHGSEARNAAQRLSARITVDSNSNSINTDDLRTVVVLCGFDTALRGLGSPWCELLTTEETEVLEYAWDLKLYWRKSHGNLINYEQSCPLLSDMMMNLQHVLANISAPKVSLYFGHAETLLPLQALLGLFHDEQELRADNYQEMRNRKFRGSLISSFAANVGFVLYECDPGEQNSHYQWPKQLDRHMIQLRVNEHAMPFPFTDKLAVSFDMFEKSYYQWIHHCDFDGICQNSKSLHNDEL